MIGVEERDTKSGIHVFRVHYSADPLKREEDWLDGAAEGMPGGRAGRAWKREMEIDWTISSGLPVYVDEFSRSVHVAKSALAYNPNLPLLRGWDFGGTPACVFAQCDALGRLYVLGELVTWDGRGNQKQSNIEAFLPLVITKTNAEYPGAEVVDYADPAGWAKSQTDGNTCAQLMALAGVYAQPGPVTWTARQTAMTRALTRMIAGAPAIVFSPAATMVVEGMSGAYKFKQVGDSSTYLEVPEKNAWSHPLDALHYIVGSTFLPQPTHTEEADREEAEAEANRAGMYY
jgi:hypothetical protein